MVRYTEHPTVNKRLVGGYYLFLCLIGFAILLGPTGSGIPITIVGDDGRYEHELAYPGMGTDSASCGVTGCHDDQWDYWNHTSHAKDLMFNGTHILDLGHSPKNMTYFNTTCAECHATGYDEADDSWDELGIGCLACHDGTSPYLAYDGEVCGDCHNPGYHANRNQYPDWELSKHADSLTDLRSSDHAATYCMHCQATESFIHQQNPGSLASFVNTSFAVDGDYNSIGCPACHSVHSNWSMIEGNAQLRANDANELCSLCHVGARHPNYQVWEDGPHDLAGVDCIDCHGYDTVYYREEGRGTLNHSFALVPELACGQEDCHDGDGQADWAINMMEMRAEAFDALTEEILADATALAAEVATYNATADANYTLTAAVQDAIDAAEDVVNLYTYDSSKGMHDGAETFTNLNEAHADLLNAKATFYKYSATGAATPAASMDMIIIIGGAAGGLVLGLVLGVLVGRRR
jgi:formate-dependent nitrite reductase cytochrome c552 subunit